MARLPPRLIEAQLRLLVAGGFRPENAVSQLIIAIWGDVTVPSEAECLDLLRIARGITVQPALDCSPHAEQRSGERLLF